MTDNSSENVANRKATATPVSAPAPANNDPVNAGSASAALNLASTTTNQLEGNILRFVMNEQLVNDENLNKVRALPGSRGDPWAFPFEDGVNKGMSVDHMEMINSIQPTRSTFDNCQEYYTNAFSQRWFLARSFLRLPIKVILDLRLKIANTGSARRLYHCDVYPTDGQNDFIDDQHAIISTVYEVEINNNS